MNTLLKAIQSKINSSSNTALRNIESSSVYELWEDGELTITKSGSLYGQRTLHQLSLPIINGTKSLDIMPMMEQRGSHACIALTKEDAQEIIQLMQQL